MEIGSLPGFMLIGASLTANVGFCNTFYMEMPLKMI